MVSLRRGARDRDCGDAVAAQLAAEGVSLLLNGNSGHELVDIGAHRFAETKPPVRAIVHFGASIAAGEPSDHALRLIDGLTIRAWAPGLREVLASAFAPLGKTLTLVADADHVRPDAWIGEARVWCALGRPLLSMAGRFALFHTPGDLPERATTPALLECVYHAILAAARILAKSV